MVKEAKVAGGFSDDSNRILVIAGLRIRTLRRQAKLKQSDIAKSIGTGPTYIVGVEAGDQNITLKTLARIAAVLGVAPAVLLLEGEMALAADEGGFDKFGALLKTAIQESVRVTDLLHQMNALASPQTSSADPAKADPPTKN